MSLQIYDWLNRIGIIIGFFSFWFVTPEFIGETRLKQWDLLLVGRAKKIKKIWYWFYLITFVIPFFIYFMYCLFFNHPLNSITYIPFITYALIDFSIAYVVKNSASILSMLANNDNVRRLSLIIGGILFTLSFILQLWASFKPQ